MIFLHLPIKALRCCSVLFAPRNWLIIVLFAITAVFASPVSGQGIESVNLVMYWYYQFNTPADVRRFVELGFDVNKADDEGNTPLRMVLRYAQTDVLDEFVKRGAVLEKTNKALIKNAMSNPAALAWLIEKGVSLDGYGEIAHWLAAKGDTAVPGMWALYGRGADLRKKNEYGKTPLNIAIDVFSVELVRSLLQMGVMHDEDVARAARLQARQLPAFKLIALCLHGPGSCGPEYIGPTGPTQRELQQYKDQIIELLKPDQRDYRSTLRERLK